MKDLELVKILKKYPFPLFRINVKNEINSNDVHLVLETLVVVNSGNLRFVIPCIERYHTNYMNLNKQINMFMSKCLNTQAYYKADFDNAILYSDVFGDVPTTSYKMYFPDVVKPPLGMEKESIIKQIDKML